MQRRKQKKELYNKICLIKNPILLDLIEKSISKFVYLSLTKEDPLINENEKDIFIIFTDDKKYDIKKFANEEGCPWFKWIENNAKLSILQWARKNGCPWDIWTENEIYKKKSEDFLEWSNNICGLIHAGGIFK